MSLTPPPIPDGFLTRWCSTLSEGSESPAGAFLPTGLALLSAIAGPRLVMRWGVAHEERMNLWVLNVGMSAWARKTSGLTGLRTAVRWVRDEDDLVRLLEGTRLSDAALVASLDVVSEDTKRAVAEEAEITPKGEKPRKINEVVRPVPLSWITVFNEVSSIWKDDGSGWAMDAQRTMLSIYDGQLSSTTRTTAVPFQDCFVTAIGNIPPGVLREQTTLGMLSSGFVGRWVVVPTPAPTRVVSFPMPNGDDPLKRIQGEVEGLMQMATRGRRHVVNDLWSEDAKEVRHQWYAGHRASVEGLSPDDPFAVAAAELFGRLQATAMKVATLIAVGRQVDTLGDLSDLRVTCDDVAWASQVIDASIEYVLASLREAGAETSSTGGKTEGRILRYLERGGAVGEQSGRSMRQVTDAAKGGPVSRGDVMRAVDGLLQSGHLAGSKSGQGRLWIP